MKESSSSLSVANDVRDFIVYGAPHSIAFYVVHLKIFHHFIDLDKYGFSKHAIDKGQYYTFFTANFLHNDIEHLMANTFGFIPSCHRMIAYLDKSNKWRSSRIFWCIYLLSGIMANIGDYFLMSSWKRLLLFYFRCDPQMTADIRERFDGLNWRETKALGASGSIYALHAFNLCISTELICKTLHESIKQREEEEGLEDDKARYCAMKMSANMLWFMVDAMVIYNGCLKQISKDWQYRKDKRAGRDYLIPSSGMIGDYTHLCGIGSGFVLYGVYKLFLQRN